jgi:multiple sugar transport system substrate-binding protein
MLDRRQFLTTASAAGLLAAGALPARAQAKMVRLFTPEADPAQIKSWRALFDAFGGTTKGAISVTGEYAGWDDLTKKIAADIVAGNPPEIVAGCSKPAFIAESAKRKLIVDMAPVVDQLNRADFDAGALKAYQYGGLQMAIPYGMQWPVMWYRKDLLGEAGVKPPTTWDEYKAAAEKLHKPDKGQFAAVFSAGRTWNTHIMALIHIWSAGGRLFDDKLNVVFDSPETRRALTYYAEMAKRFSPPDIGQYGFREASAAFTSGRAATTFYWGRVLAHLYGQNPGLLPKTGTLHIPRDKETRTFLTFDEFYVYRTPNAQQAIEVVKFLMQPRNVMAMLEPAMPNVSPTQKTVDPIFRQHDWIKSNPDIVTTLITPNSYAIAATTEGPTHPFNYKYDVVESKNLLPDCVQRIVLGGTPVATAVAETHKRMVAETKDLRG